MNNKIKLLFLLSVLGLMSFSFESKTIEKSVDSNVEYARKAASFFSLSDSFFKTYVYNGKVDYVAVKKNKVLLNKLFEIAKDISIPKEKKSDYQAFWINAYNLSVIKGIVDNYPIKSPLDKKGFFDTKTYALGTKNVTLNHIEHQLLRKQFNDPRFHFVLVCGAIGCPPLINKVYLPKTLEAQLQKQTVLALNGDYFIKVNTKKKLVEGSEILKWYKEDFTLNGKTEIDFINKYRKIKIPTSFKLIYFPYVWSINKK